MKAILVVDMPEEYMGSVIDVKLYGKGETVHEKYVNKLKPMPQKKGLYANDYGYNMMAQGWNQCLEEIIGETE